MAETSQETVKVKIPIHLRLTYEDWKENFKGLTRAELGVFYAIRTLDPFGDRELEIDCKALGDELGLHRTSVSRSLESLSKRQLIDLEIVKAKVKQKVNNKKLTLLTRVENESNQEQKEESEICASTHTNVRPRTEQCGHAQSVAPTHTDVRPRTNQPPEPLPQADSKTPHTSSDSSDLNQTLSEGKPEFSQFWNGLAEEERERFEDYCKAITANYQKPVVNVADWLAGQDKAGRNYWEVHYKEFKASEAAATSATDEASQAQQQKRDAMRKQAEEFLSERNTDPDRDKKCVPAPQKSAVQPQETVEETEVSNKSGEGAKEPKTAGKGFRPGQERVEKIRAQHKKPRKPTEQETEQSVRRSNSTPPPYS